MILNANRMFMRMMFEALKVILICTAIGLSFGTYFYFTAGRHFSSFVTSVVSSVSIGSLMMLAIRFRRYFTMITTVQYLKVVIIIVLLILASLLGSELTLLIKVRLFGSDYIFLNGMDMYILNVLISLVTGIPIYISEEWKEALNSRVLNQQLKLLQLEQQNTTFELELLRAKINPHFLYNVHNTIAGLISKDPQKAEKMVLLLSRFFRSTLNKTSATYHLISDEIDIIKTYLELQSIRYEERLNYKIHITEGLLNLEMPSFILQPLVENSIKHGIEKKSGKGSIVVTITSIDKEINIRVADTGDDFPQFPGLGVGLETVSNKLRLLYKDNFQINFSKLPHKYVEIIFPEGN